MTGQRKESTHLRAAVKQHENAYIYYLQCWLVLSGIIGEFVYAGCRVPVLDSVTDADSAVLCL